LDTGFGNGGITTTNFVAWTDSEDIDYSAALQTDGRILLVGATNEGTFRDDAYNFALARYNPDGSLDTLFGSGHPNYIRGAPPIVLDSNAKVLDPDLAASGNYGGASVTLARHGGA